MTETPRTTSPTEYVSTRWGDVAYSDTGDPGTGRLPVVFLHGNSFSRKIFERQLRSSLADDRRLIAIDFLGHGDSSDASDPESAYRQGGYAETVAEVLDALKIPEAVVVGWSLGGHVGLELIPRFPGLAGLVISGTPPVGADDFGEGFLPGDGVSIAGTENITEDEAADFAAQATSPSDAQQFAADVVRTDGRARRVMFEAFGAGKESNQRALAETSSVPLAIIDGAQDPFVNPDYVASLSYANLWRDAPQIIDQAGHDSFWEQSATYNALLEEFLDDLESGR